MKDPIALLERVKNRVTFIHLKDGTGEGRGTPLGRGFAPIKEVREWAINNGKQMIVESETLKPSGIEEVKICFDYLKTIE
jgi:sugar phosphate isomerase/epimerase